MYLTSFQQNKAKMKSFSKSIVDIILNKEQVTAHYIRYADAFMNSAECLEDQEAGILNEVIQAGNQEEVIHENLSTTYKHLTITSTPNNCL